MARIYSPGKQRQRLASIRHGDIVATTTTSAIYPTSHRATSITTAPPQLLRRRGNTKQMPAVAAADIVPTWGCIPCGLLFQCHKRGLFHCRNSHSAEISAARSAGGDMAAEAATASILTWYHRVSDSLLPEVIAAAEAAQMIAGAKLSSRNNPELRKAVRDAIMTPVKQPAAKRQRLRKDDLKTAPGRKKHLQLLRGPSPPPSPKGPPPVIATFRVKLQSLSRFTSFSSEARFPDGTTSFYFQFLMTEEATVSPDVMLDALNSQYEESSGVCLNLTEMAQHRWYLIASEVGNVSSVLDVHDEIDDFAGVFGWVMAHLGDWNRLMEIG